MKTRPAVGTRVKIGRGAGFSRDVHGKTGVVVAGLKFRRREGDWCLDCHDVREVPHG